MKEKTMEVKPGMGATVHIGSDSYPYTVSRVSPSGKTIWVKRDNYTATKGSDYYGMQSYTYTRDPDAREEKFTKVRGKAGKQFPDAYKNGCYRLWVGTRRAYEDPSF